MKEKILGCTVMNTLVITTVFSWLLFPILLKFLAPLAFKTLFLSIFSGVVWIHWRYREGSKFELSKEQYVFFVLWGGYLLALMLATVIANDLYAYKQLASNFLKMMFFFLLLFFINRDYIYKTFSIYANLMVVSVVAALLVSVGVAMEVLEPVSTLRHESEIESHYNFDIYWGSYYRLSQIYASFPLFRLQGFAEEPGTFAFALMPALFWMLIVKKAPLRSIILGAGMLGTYSIGAGLALVVLVPLILKVRSVLSAENLFISGLLSLFVFMYAVPYLTDEPLFQWASQFTSESSLQGQVQTYDNYVWAEGLIENKGTSLSIRGEAVSVVLSYLSGHPIGTGAGLGMTTVDYAIAVGYANAALESGVVGGVSYVLMFALLSWFAIKMIWQSGIPTDENKMRIAVGLSVLSCILMGMQRQQPDISFWHMWIYASMFYLLLKPRNESRLNRLLPAVRR